MINKDFEFDDVVLISKNILLEQGQHKPQFMFHTDNGWIVSLFNWKDEVEKSIAEVFFRKLCQEEKVDKYFFITECWGINRPDGVMNYKLPSECDDKEEFLMIQEFKNDLTVKTKILVFEHEKDKIKIVEERFLEGEQSNRFNFYLEYGGHFERMDNLRKKK